MKCAIVDDEPLALSLMESYVQKTPMLLLCGKYSSAVQVISGLREEPVDLLFLDIQMPELTGLDLSRLIDTTYTRIVFTTAFSQYAIDGYKVNALDYLLKPISYSDFIGAVNRAQQWFELLNRRHSETGVAERETLADEAGNGHYMYVKSDYKILRIDFDDIQYVEGLKDYVKFYLSSSPRPVISLTSMRAIEGVLPASAFMRVHRSYIVNMNQVAVFERGQIVFGDKYVPVSDSYRAAVQEYINAHLLQGRNQN